MNAVIKTIDDIFQKQIHVVGILFFVGALPRPLSALPSCRFCSKQQKRNGTGRSGFVAKAPQELHVGLRGAISGC